MCGIAGFTGPDKDGTLSRMADAMAHRGPDARGFYASPDGTVSFAHTRLSIIDTASGNQPMRDATERICVVYNGEIYNAPELRSELEAAGYTFISDHSDTEVLVHGYLAWGAELPERLKGMFAFVIHDRKRQHLFMARDHLGEKPLFYHHAAQHFAFASELPALLEHPGIDRAFDAESLQKYFAYGFFPSPRTPFRSCRKLPPGTSALFEIQSGRFSENRYWRYRAQPTEDGLGDTARAEKLGDLIDNAVRRRLQSDVPLGAFLSGGIDSAIVAHSMRSQHGAEQTRTFTIGFDNPDFDESADAAKLASILGIDNTVERLNAKDIAQTIEARLGLFSEPLADASIVPTYLLSRLTARDVKVALTGDGADELFAGYDTFAAMRPARCVIGKMPTVLHDAMKWLVGNAPLTYGKLDTREKAWHFLKASGYAPALWNPLWAGPMPPDIIAEVFSHPLPVDELYSEAIELWESSVTDDICRMSEYYANLFLPERILTKVDRASMQASLETRPVFLDIDIVNFTADLPSRLRMNGIRRKAILKDAVRGRLPGDVLERKKRGFSIPLAEWYRNETLPAPTGVADGMDSAGLSRLVAASKDGFKRHQYALFAKTSVDKFLNLINGNNG